MSPKMVLYAEDDFANRKLMEIQLTKKGITCDCVENGRKALEFFGANEYKIIILDQNMPEKTGSEVAREIRKINLNIPIIALTSDDSNLDHFRKSGFSDIMIKPIIDNSLIDRVLELLG